VLISRYRTFLRNTDDQLVISIIIIIIIIIIITLENVDATTKLHTVITQMTTVSIQFTVNSA